MRVDIGDDARELRLEPVVARLDGVAVGTAALAVHIVALVGGDEREAGYAVVGEVGRKRAVRLAVGRAIGIGLRRRIARHVLEEDERVVLGVVETARSDGARAG